MLLAFEGTGMQPWGGTSSWGVNDWSNSKSFVWNFFQYSTSPSGLKKYFPGPNIQGSNCDDILDDAKNWYRERKNSFGPAFYNQKIVLVGYSRGSYMAMCFAKFLQINNRKVHFMGLFDAVSRDLSVEAIISTTKIPTNVENCFHAARSPIIGSRNVTMDQVGIFWESGSALTTRVELPGSHGALGGFPNEAGMLDSPNPGQGSANDSGKFDSRKEITAAWEAGNHISAPAMQKGLLSKRLVDAAKPKEWLPREEWYKPKPVPKLTDEQLDRMARMNRGRY